MRSTKDDNYLTIYMPNHRDQHANNKTTYKNEKEKKEREADYDIARKRRRREEGARWMAASIARPSSGARMGDGDSS